METTARDSYLASQIETATPQKLQLMLIDGAIRFGSQAKHKWEEGDDEAAADALIRCHKIVGELLASVRSGESEMSHRLSDI